MGKEKVLGVIFNEKEMVGKLLVVSWLLLKVRRTFGR